MTLRALPDLTPLSTMQGRPRTHSAIHIAGLHGEALEVSRRGNCDETLVRCSLPDRYRLRIVTHSEGWGRVRPITGIAIQAVRAGDEGNLQ